MGKGGRLRARVHMELERLQHLPGPCCPAASTKADLCVPQLFQGDSGGPLVCGKGKVDGILSFSSKNCTDIFKPTVATAVAPYSSWIRKVIGRWSPQPLT